MKNLNLLILIIFLLPAIGLAQETCLHSSAGSLAPIRVMGSHTHNKGSWMFSYQLMHMNMQDNLMGRSSIHQESILNDYMMAPDRMNMQMHMVMGMFAISDKVTVMGMLPYLHNSMDMADRMGMRSKMGNSNVGDVSLTAMYSIFKSHHTSLQANLGVSIPTGSIQESQPTEHVHGNHVHQMEECLPYMMQTGSGTWDILPAVDFTTVLGKFVWGAQGQARLRTGQNLQNYRLGNVASFDSWLSYQQNNWLSFSFRLQGTKSWIVNGMDPQLDPMMTPASNAMNTGGETLNSFAGTSIAFQRGALKGQRLAMEYGVPLYQDLNGIQMQAKRNIILGWQISF